MSASHLDITPHPSPIRQRALWFGLFGGPALWSVEILLNYSLAAHGCYPQQRPLSISILPDLRVMLGIVIVLAAAGTIAAGRTAFVSWRASEANTARVRFMAFCGILMSALFLFLILINGIPIFVVPPCTYGA